MKLLHLSDLHIGLKLMNRDLMEDQIYILQQIADIAAREKPDAVVIAGDLYDKAVPSAEAALVFDRFVSALSKAVPEAEIMMISGNHDSAARINLYRSVLEPHRIHMIGLPPQRPEEHIEKVTLRDEFGPVHFWLLPFVKPSMVKEIVGTDDSGNNLSYDASIRRLLAREAIDPKERNVFVSHQFYLPMGKDADQVERMESEVRTVGNIDAVRADVLAPFDYAGLGHIHKPMKVGSEFYRYPGTPIASSLDEAGQRKGAICVELGAKGDVRTKVLPLTPLRQVRKIRGSLEEVVLQACDDYVSVTLTDKVDLDVIDMQERLRGAFPYLLEIRREYVRGVSREASYTVEEGVDPYALCERFLGEVTQEEQRLLREVIDEARGF